MNTSDIQMKEEKYIEERVGKRNPFLVPDGYFDDFTAQLMQQLPERQPRAKVKSLRRPIYWAVACVCALFVTGTAWMFLSKSDMPVTMGSDPSVSTMGADPSVSIADDTRVADPSVTSFDEAADYMMLDNNEIYNYLADN